MSTLFFIALIAKELYQKMNEMLTEDVEPPGIAPDLSVFQTILRTSYNKTQISINFPKHIHSFIISPKFTMKMFNNFILPYYVLFSKNIIFDVSIMKFFIIFDNNISLFVICIYKISNSRIELSTILSVL